MTLTCRCGQPLDPRVYRLLVLLDLDAARRTCAVTLAHRTDECAGPGRGATAGDWIELRRSRRVLGRLLDLVSVDPPTVAAIVRLVFVDGER